MATALCRIAVSLTTIVLGYVMKNARDYVGDIVVKHIHKKLKNYFKDTMQKGCRCYCRKRNRQKRGKLQHNKKQKKKALCNRKKRLRRKKKLKHQRKQAKK